MFPYFYFFVEIKTLTATNRLTNCWCIFGITRPSFNFAHCRKISKKRDRSAVNYTLLNKTMIFFSVLPCTICNKTVAKAVEWCKKNWTFLGRRSFQKNKGRRTFFFLLFFLVRAWVQQPRRRRQWRHWRRRQWLRWPPKLPTVRWCFPKTLFSEEKKYLFQTFFRGHPRDGGDSVRLGPVEKCEWFPNDDDHTIIFF